MEMVQGYLGEIDFLFFYRQVESTPKLTLNFTYCPRQHLNPQPHRGRATLDTVGHHLSVQAIKYNY